MKRVLFLAAALLFIGMGAMAQSAKSALQFVDENGNIIADGSVVELTKVTCDEDGADAHMKPNLFVKNVTTMNKVVALKFELSSMPNGYVQCCVGSCKMLPSQGEISGTMEIEPGKFESIDSEWFPEENASAVTWIATITAGLCNKPEGGVAYEYAEDGPSIKVKFVYTPPTGIETVKDGNATVTEVERYNVQGQKISKPCKGINIIKLSNGKTVKKVMK